MASWQFGATRFEFLVRVIIVTLLGTVLLERLLYYQEYAEKTVMEANLTSMRSGLRWRVAELMIQNRNGEIVDLLKENPVHWLEQPPPDYQGEIGPGEAEAADRDGWFFDPFRHELVYKPRLHRHFRVGLEGRALIRFRVTAKIVRRSNDAGAMRVEGVELVSVDQYKWF